MKINWWNTIILVSITLAIVQINTYLTGSLLLTILLAFLLGFFSNDLGIPMFTKND